MPFVLVVCSFNYKRSNASARELPNTSLDNTQLFLDHSTSSTLSILPAPTSAL